MAAPSSPSAPTQVAYRTLKGIGLLDASPVYQSPPDFATPEGGFRCSAYSGDGRFFAWASPDEVTVVDPSTGRTVTVLPAPSVYELGFSPLGTYIITWQRPSKDEAGDAVKNLRVWRTIDSGAGAEGERDVVGQFVQKSQTGWNLQYTSDEKFCARVVTNEVQFYQSGDLATVWNKLRAEGVTDFAVSPGEAHAVAIFVPERKGMPAAVKVYKVPEFENAVSQKTFFKGDKVQLKWNGLGTSLIVLATTEVDKSNRSYYGETNMYILSANGGFDSRIQLDKEGPIHDVTWSPTSKTFGVVYGYMPAKTTIFNTKADVVHNFALAPRNTILFSPHGRFILVAGFGNLAGQMDIYDLTKDYAKLVTIEASNASVCEWSPDGRHILTATTSPRLRVDNGIRVWHVSGSLMYNEEMHELYTVTWRPQSAEQHPIENPLNPPPPPHASALAKLATVKTPSKPAGAYRPPGARGTLTPLHFKREDEGGAAYTNNGISSTSGDRGQNGFGGPRRRREVPGAEPVADGNASLPPGAAPGGGVSLTPAEVGDENLTKAALKNKKKREARKARDKEGAIEGGDAPAGSNAYANGDAAQGQQQQYQQQYRTDSAQRGNNRAQQPRTAPAVPPGFGPSPAHADQQLSQQQQQPQQLRDPSTPKAAKGQPLATAAAVNHSAAVPQSSQQPTSTPLSPPSHDGPAEKKVRALTKKLRAIEDLKMRQAGGEKLELSQLSKIQTEETVKKDLEALGGSLI